MQLQLSSKALPALLANDQVSVPEYDRSRLTAGILHIGVGNFHRAHMASYVDDLFRKVDDFESNKEWGIVGAGLLSFDDAKRKLLQPQDWLQTLVAHDADTTEAKIIGSMIDFLPVDESDPSVLRKRLQDPAIKIVSLTVTEGGYFLHDGKFDVEHPAVKHDIAHPDEPRTIFGMMVQALRIRREAGLPPFTVLSCDNIPHNGDVAKSALVGMATAMMGDAADWIASEVSCPNSMVDRITPGTTDEHRAYVQTKYGYHDASPVFCEPWRQWILEDKFPAGRPPLEQLDNVKFVTDVAKYERMKVRILNGGHAALCYPAALLGVQFVHEAMDHPTIGPFVHALERNEIIPTVPAVPDVNLNEYWDTVAHRFANPTINDTIVRNCYDGASRQPKFVVPAARDNVTAGRSARGLALVSAMWCRYCMGTTERGAKIGPNDPQWDRLHGLALEATTDPSVWLLGLRDVYGETLPDSVDFRRSFEGALELIQEKGVEAAMKKYVEASVM